MSFLKISRADFRTGDVRGNRDYRHATSVAVVQSVDEVQITGPTPPGADWGFPREAAPRAGREGGHLLVTHSNPLDPTVTPDRIRNAIERIAHQAINSRDSRSAQCLN